MKELANNYQICKRCVMDSSDSDIVFDEKGYCNHCSKVLDHLASHYLDETRNNEVLKRMITEIREYGAKQSYDCIIGLSGGIDSSYLAYLLVKKYNLKPLAVHLDNGWNSENAVHNIHNLVQKLNIDLITHVINWEEFRELQKSFLKASVVDLEMLSDHAIVIIINKLATKHKIKHFVIGGNYQTESIMPRSWFYSDKRNSKHIREIYNKYGSGLKLKTFPLLNMFEYYTFAKKYGQYLSPLSYMKYNKDEAKQILIDEMGWREYGLKHHESFITKFYQIYILPNKFNIDKRRAHLSSMICSGQITREDALADLAKPFFSSQQEKDEAISYFCKKMEITSEEFKIIMSSSKVDHSAIKSYGWISRPFKNFVKSFVKI